MMQRRGGGRLPSEYQEVEYLHSGGSQYILLPYKKTGRAHFSAYLTCGGLDNSGILGGYSSAHVEYFIAQIYSNRKFSLFYGPTRNFDFGMVEIGVSYYMEIDDYDDHSDCLINGVLYQTSHSPYLNTQDYLALFCGYTGWKKFKGNVGIVEYEDTINHSVFIPCYRKADNEPGMYDIINDVFYTNSGSGTFVVGPDVTGGGGGYKLLIIILSYSKCSFNQRERRLAA